VTAPTPFRSLPDGFIVGTASSAFQVEGALTADGRLPSIWDEFLGPEDAGVASACDHHARVDSDLELLAGLGVDAYRFSIAWPRVIAPDGSVNERGLDFYRRVVETLRAAGIAPIACLYHWDLPQWLQERGGWGSRDTARRLGEYATRVAARLDGVELWATMNEPFVQLLMGHIAGKHAPGLQLRDWSATAHHLLLGHGEALAALRAEVGHGIGLIENVAPIRPAGTDPRDAQAAAAFDALRNQLTLGTVLTGAYPAPFERHLAPSIQDGDLELISAPLDFLGINYYGSQAVTAAPECQIPPWRMADQEGLAQTPRGHTIDPDGLTEALVTLAERYPETLPPLLVAEFGLDDDDEALAAGQVDDGERVVFLDRHLEAIGRAIDLGVDVRGAFVWSFLDSFEWSRELGMRYGLVHVDFATGERTPKRSYRRLAEALAARPERAAGAVGALAPGRAAAA
jgi:beta-glucosidase